MSDLIERDKAINILDVIDVDIIPYADTREYVQSAIDYIRKELGDIPSARPNNRGVCGVCAGRKVCGKNNRNLDMLECSIFELDEHYKISRPKGEWIKEHGVVYCSNCNHSHWSDCYEDTVVRFNFCPNCGADMREREGE